MTRRHPTDDAVLAAVIKQRAAHRDTSANSLSYGLGVSASTARKRLNQLVDQGLLSTGRKPHDDLYCATPAGLERNTQTP